MVMNAAQAPAGPGAWSSSLEEIKRGIEKVEALNGRFHMIEHNGMLIVDDCCNASPVAMMASLDILMDAEGRKVAILGDMFELGENELEFTQASAPTPPRTRLDLLICVGERSRHMAEAAFEGGGCGGSPLDPRLDALETLPKLVQTGDTILRESLPRDAL